MKKVDLSGLDPKLEPESETIHRLTRMGIGLIPVVGGSLLEVFNSILESPLSKRRTETMIQLGEVINDLIEQGVVTEAGLQANDAFISTVAEVCAISLRNHQSEKLEALRNAVRNAALPTCPSDDYRQMFLNYIDQFTVTHLKILRFANDPTAWFAATGTHFPGYKSGDIKDVIDAAIPELQGHSELRDAIWSDLALNNLIELHLTIDDKAKDETFDRKTTPMGAELVRFIG